MTTTATSPQTSTTGTNGDGRGSDGKAGSSGASTVDAAAQASIGAAARELHLPTVRTEAARLATEPAGRQ